jgi:hypothetical protein
MTVEIGKTCLVMMMQGREGLVVKRCKCRWHLNWFTWCPAVSTVAGAYGINITYQEKPVNAPRRMSRLWSFA